MFVILLAAAMLGSGEPQAPAAAAKPSSAAPVKTAKPNPDELVCRMEQLPNSRIRKRVCMTRAQAEARGAQDRQTVEMIQNRAAEMRR